jgi:hypothetical protein
LISDVHRLSDGRSEAGRDAANATAERPHDETANLT